jgi:hypothetical protein
MVPNAAASDSTLSRSDCSGISTDPNARNSTTNEITEMYRTSSGSRSASMESMSANDTG